MTPDIKYLAKRFATCPDMVERVTALEERIFQATADTIDPGVVIYADFDFNGYRYHLDAVLIVSPEYAILDKYHLQATSIGSFLIVVETCSATDCELYIGWEADEKERQQLAGELSVLIDPLLFWHEVKVDKEKGTRFNPRKTFRNGTN